MTINFRRNALQLSVAALFSSAFMANAADVPQVKVTVTDKQCEPMTITVNAGKTQFIIQNHSQKALEWEILKGVMVVEERERAGVGRACDGAGGGAGGDCAGGKPGKPRAGLSELRVGRLWRGVWSSGAVLGDVVTHDA